MLLRKKCAFLSGTVESMLLDHKIKINNLMHLKIVCTK